MTLQLTSTVDNGTVTVAVAGEIDMATADQFRRGLAAATGHDRLVVDLTAVDFLDSAGIRVLYEYVDHRPELIVVADGFIARILTITGLHDILPIRKL